MISPKEFSKNIRSFCSVILLILGLTVVRNFFGERMFSLLSLQPTHSIDSFAELAKRVDVIPIKTDNFDIVVKKLLPNHSVLNSIIKTRSLIKKGGNVAADLLEPNRVLLANLLFIKRIPSSLESMPFKISDERLVFILYAKYSIQSSGNNRKWVLELRQWYVLELFFCFLITQYFKINRN